MTALVELNFDGKQQQADRIRIAIGDHHYNITCHDDGTIKVRGESGGLLIQPQYNNVITLLDAELMSTAGGYQ